MKRALLILLGLLALAAAVAWARFPRPSVDRVEVLPGIVGVSTGGSMAWIVRTPNGAALVDAGLDPKAEVLLEELGRMGLGADDVHTLLITHAHFDHWGGAARFPKARIVVGQGDGPLIRGETRPSRFMVSTVARLLQRTHGLPNAEELAGDGELDVDGLTFRAVHVPGHTPGSVVFLHGPLLFTGDSAIGAEGGRGFGPPPAFLSEDAVQNKVALKRLLELNLPFTLAADGHTGVVVDAKAKLADALP